MNQVRAWLRDRRPRPPMSLEPWLGGAAARGADPIAGGGGEAAHAAAADSLDPAGPVDVFDATSVAAALGALAREALAAARARPGRVRQSAFDLLAADALLTYACEAAVDADDLHAALRGLLADGAAP